MVPEYVPCWSCGSQKCRLDSTCPEYKKPEVTDEEFLAKKREEIKQKAREAICRTGRVLVQLNYETMNQLLTLSQHTGVPEGVIVKGWIEEHLKKLS